MKGFLKLFEMLDWSVQNKCWDLARLNIYKIEGAIFYASEMEIINKEQYEELTELIEEKLNLIQ